MNEQFPAIFVGGPLHGKVFNIDHWRVRVPVAEPTPVYLPSDQPLAPLGPEFNYATYDIHRGWMTTGSNITHVAVLAGHKEPHPDEVAKLIREATNHGDE